jgi:predicted O-methyltransferase YrrM
MTRRRRLCLWLVAMIVALSAAAAGVTWLRLTVLPFRGLDPSPALVVVRELEVNGNLRAADRRVLYDQIVGRGYKRGLELGTAEGCSGLWMAMALRKTGGSLVTIEIDPATAERARQNFRRAQMDDIVELRIADAVEEAPRVPGELDFVFIDVAVPLNKKLLDLVRGHVRPGGAILAHNAEAFRWTQPDFLDAITHDPQLETSFPGLIFEVSISVKRY